MSILNSSLDSAIVWCNQRLDWKALGICFRSAELFGKSVKKPEDSNITYLEFSEVEALVNHIIAKRIELVKNNPISISPCSGKILCFYPEYSLNDAMVADECQMQIDSIYSGSYGKYIDDFDNPPWDTWIHCELNKGTIALYSWVHPELVGLVSNAIATDAYGCLVWAEEFESRLNLNSTVLES